VQKVVVLRLKFVNYCKKQRGQALVEFALVLPILLITLFGTIETARMMNLYLSLQEVTRNGAIYGSRADPTLSLDPKTVAEATFKIMKDNIPLRFSANGSWLNKLPEDVIITDVNHEVGGILYTKVTISVTLSFLLLPNFGKDGGGIIPITCSSMIINETQAKRSNAKAVFESKEFQIIELARESVKKELE
jgi:hypothetical protein